MQLLISIQLKKRLVGESCSVLWGGFTECFPVKVGFLIEKVNGSRGCRLNIDKVKEAIEALCQAKGARKHDGQNRYQPRCRY